MFWQSQETQKLPMLGLIQEVRDQIYPRGGSKKIELREVTFGYVPCRPVLKSVNLIAVSGATTALIGGNGQGKTTLMRIVCGTLRPQEGTVDPLPGALLVGYSAANSEDLNPLLSVGQVLQMINQRLDNRFTIPRLLEALNFTSNIHRARVSRLSSGERKRLSLFRALVLGRDAVLLDEPLSHLDVEYRRHFSAILKWLTGRVTILLSSHDLPFVNAICQQAFLVKSDDAAGSPGKVEMLSLPVDTIT